MSIDDVSKANDTPDILPLFLLLLFCFKAIVVVCYTDKRVKVVIRSVTATLPYCSSLFCIRVLDYIFPFLSSEKQLLGQYKRKDLHFSNCLGHCFRHFGPATIFGFE